MVSKLLESSPSFHRITRSHTSSFFNFFSFSLSLLPRAQLFNARHHREGGGKAEGNFARERQVSSDIQTRRERNRCHPRCHLNRQKPRFRTRLLIYFAIGKTYGSRPTTTTNQPTNRFTLLPSIDLPSWSRCLDPLLTDVNPARDDMRVDLKINAPPD